VIALLDVVDGPCGPALCDGGRRDTLPSCLGRLLRFQCPYRQQRWSAPGLPGRGPMNDSIHGPRWQDDRRTSAVLREILQNQSDQPVTLGGLIAAMGNRSHGLLLLLFALPTLLPVAFPGMTTL